MDALMGCYLGWRWSCVSGVKMRWIEEVIEEVESNAFRPISKVVQVRIWFYGCSCHSVGLSRFFHAAIVLAAQVRSPLRVVVSLGVLHSIAHH